MSLFSKKLLGIILTAVIFTGGLLFNHTALAQSDEGDITVEIQNNSSQWVLLNSQSLFSEENFLSGQDVTRRVRVTNNTEEKQKIGVKFIDTSGVQCSGNCLSNKLDISISNSNPPCSGTLTDFYKNGETYFSDINATSEMEYDLSIKFISSAGNDFQDLAVKFDIEIGFFGEESIGAEIHSNENGEIAKSGKAIIVSGVEISGENVSVGVNQATVSWTTTYKSTSRVIYSPQNFPHLFNLNNPPNYGYTSSSVEKDNADPINYNGTTNHSVILHGLLSGTTYYYRAISHASPPSITEERSFTTLESSSSGGKSKKYKKHKKKFKSVAVVLANAVSPAPVGQGNNNATEGEQSNPGEAVAGEEQKGETEGISAKKCQSWPEWIWILALAISIAIFAWDARRNYKKEKYDWKLAAALTIIALIFWYFFDFCHQYYWFVSDVVLAALIIHFIYAGTLKRKR